MKVAVIQFPGSNCDRDCLGALKRAGFQAELVWSQDTSLKGFRAVILPGGFSYGDYLRPGALSAKDSIMKEVSRLAKRGYPILGICNGFQILTEAKMLPGALLRNTSLRFICKSAKIKVVSDRSSFARGLAGKTMSLPVAHMDGGYFLDEQALRIVEDNDQVVFTYSGENPNGSVKGIAGVCSYAGNVVGMMPHPERVSDPLLGSEEGLEIFTAMLA